MIVPALRVVTHPVTLCVTPLDAERPQRHSHAERGNDQVGVLSRIHLPGMVANEMDYQFCLFRHFYPLNSAPLAFGYLCARRKNNKYLA